jgi:hypothetical protein
MKSYPSLCTAILRKFFHSFFVQYLEFVPSGIEAYHPGQSIDLDGGVSPYCKRATPKLFFVIDSLMKSSVIAWGSCSNSQLTCQNNKEELAKEK